MSENKKPRKSDSRLKGYVQIEGQKYWVQAYSREELDEKKRRKKEEVQQRLDYEIRYKRGNMTVQAWSEEWLDTYKSGQVGLSHYRDIKARLNNWVLPYIGKKRIKDVEQKDIQKIMNLLKGYSRSQINKVYDDIKGMFNQAVYNRYIVANPALGVKKPEAKPSQRRRSVTEEERTVIIETAKCFNGGIFYLIMLYAGLRPGEVAALKVKQIDLEEKIIHVRDALKSDGTIADTEDRYNGKTINASRDIFLAKDLESEVRKAINNEKLKPDDYIAHKRRSREHHTHTSIRTMWESFRIAMHIRMGGETDRSLKKCKEYQKDDEGNILSSRQIRYSVEIPIDDKVAKDLVPYDLRHTFCTDLRERGVPIEEAKDLMGHANIALTSKIYSHATVTSIERARKLYDGELSAVKETE